MAHERKAYSISYQISTHKQVFVTLSSCIGLKRNIGGSVLRAVLQNCHFRVASLSQCHCCDGLPSDTKVHRGILVHSYVMSVIVNRCIKSDRHPAENRLSRDNHAHRPIY